VEATVFHSTATEFDYDQTRQDNPALPNYQGPKLNVLGYASNGLELETIGSIGSFALNVNLLYSKEKITQNLGSPGVVGNFTNAPRFRFTISPRYAIADVEFGATVRGESWSYTSNDNTTKNDGFYLVSAFARYNFGGGLSGSVNINNLFDKVVGGGGFVGGSNTVVGGSGDTGRTISATVRYAF
jgi:outer membrane receptor for ferric coprogen and ferric-rhodotorulic acid